MDVVASCPCDLGCPSCVHSPKCGSGNRPIDKAAALFLLGALRDAPAPDIGPQCLPQLPDKREEASTDGIAVTAHIPNAQLRYGVLDVETQLSAQEVGGWRNARDMRVSCCVLYDSETNEYTAYREDELPAMFERLQELDLIIGFNILRFDYSVLGPYAGALDLHSLPTLDMLQEVRRRLGYRLSLDALGAATLGAQKTADGLQALAWWKEGRIDEIIEYCTKDVELTRDLYLHGREHGYLLFTNKAKQTVRLPVEW